MKKSSLIGVLIGASIVGGGIVSFAQESITLTTYYPSPKGMYDEVRANKFSSIDHPDDFFVDMKSGEASISRFKLKDEKTGDLYELKMQDGQLIVADLKRKKGFIVVDFNQPQPTKQ
jgi:hypothetical protein